jgi:hypothetical protein
LVSSFDDSFELTRKLIFHIDDDILPITFFIDMFYLFMLPTFALACEAFTTHITVVGLKTHMNVLMMHQARRTSSDVAALNFTVIDGIPIDYEFAIVHVTLILF